MCQVVEGPFLKSGFSSLLRRVDISIKIGSSNDFLTKHDDFLIKHLHSLKHKKTLNDRGACLRRKISFEKRPPKQINAPKGHFH